MTQPCYTSAPQKPEAPPSPVSYYCPQETLYTPYRQWRFSLPVVREPAKMCTQQGPNESLGRERGKGGGKVVGESKNTRAIPSTNATHLQLLSFHLRRRARWLHFHSVLLHQVLQALPQLLSELLLLLFRLMSDFTKVLFILLLQALYFTACSFLGL